MQLDGICVENIRALLEYEPDLCGNPVRTWLTTLSSRVFYLCICRANQGEFTQPRHGIPGLGIGLDMLLLKELLVLTHIPDYRPSSSG